MIVLVVRDLTGGIRKHIVSILSRYSQRPDDILLVTHLPEADLAFQNFLRRHSQFTHRILNLPIRRAPHPLDLWHGLHLWWTLHSLRRPLVLHGHGAKGGLLARLVGRALGAKVIYTPHGGSLHNMFSRAKRTLYIAVERFLHPLTDVFLFESDYSLRTYESFVRSSSPRYILNRNGISLPSLKPTHQESQLQKKHAFIIGVFGSLRRLKGYDLLIQAAARLLKKGMEVELRIFGEGEERRNLEILSESLNAKSQVHFLGETASSETEMRYCDLVVQPSRFESFGYTALEALALGIPVIVSNSGGLPEVVEDVPCGLIFENENVTALADALESAMKNAAAMRSCAKAASKKILEKFSEEKMLDAIEQTYKYQ